MTEVAEMTGSCLCGSAAYTITGAPMMVGDCYCTDCRKSSGTSHATHVAVSAGAFRASGPVTYHEHAADSGNLVRRAFCPKCGSSLFSTNSAMPALVFVRASGLADPNLVTPELTVYAKRAPKWARIDHTRPVFDGMATEVAAEMAGGAPAS